MVNFGLNSASILGLFLAVAGAGLYFMRSVRPELSRDHDIFFAAVGLLCGLILLFQGWRLDPILQFGQFLLTGSAVFFAVETIRLRGVTTEQARRNGPIVEDRPVSNAYSYQAELEALEPYEEEDYEPRGRLRGTDYRNPRGTGYDGEEAPRPTRSRRPSSSDAYSGGEVPPRKRRPRATTSSDNYNAWDEQPPPRSERPSARPRRPNGDVERSASETRQTKKRRPRPNEETRIRETEVKPTDYVDYQPIDQPSQADWMSHR